MLLYSELLAFCQQLLPTWRKTQQVNLALLAQAIFQRRSLMLTELARSYPIPEKRKVLRPKHGLLHRTKRLWRFVAHPKLDESGLMKRLTRLSTSVCRSPGLLLPVIIDLTYFNSFAVFSASVPRSGRALPIAWRVFSRNLEGESALSQNQLIDRVLAQMRERLAAAIKPVVIADREFARASLFRWIKGLDAHFVIRVDNETWVLHTSYSGPLQGLAIRPGGRRVWLTGACYSKEERVPVNLLAVWSVAQEEPWFIASDLDDPIEVERLYRKRMKIEHGFRDWKHHLRLKGTPKVRSAGSLGRLLSAVIVLYWYVCMIAMRLKGHPCTVEVRAWGRLGECKLGLELLQLDSEAVHRTAKRLILWVADKLFGLSPPTPAYKLRYHRFRCWLPQTG